MAFDSKQFGPKTTAVSTYRRADAPITFPFTSNSSYSLYEEPENSLSGLLRTFADISEIKEKIRQDRGVDLDTKNNLAYILADAIKVNPSYTPTILYIIKKMKPYQRANLIIGILKFSGPLSKYNSPEIILNEQQIIIFGSIYSNGIGDLGIKMMPTFIYNKQHAKGLERFFNETHRKALPEIIRKRIFGETDQNIPEIIQYIVDYSRDDDVQASDGVVVAPVRRGPRFGF